MEWRAYGPHAALIQFGNPADRTDWLVRGRAISAALEVGVDGVTEWTLAFDHVLLEFSRGTNVANRTPELIELFGTLESVDNAHARHHRIAVRYDGEDLALVAKGSGLSEPEVVEVHTSTIYDVAMLGFAPGFPYLTGLDERLATPRRAEPRSRVPTGAVAIGGSHTGIYSVPSPGGWNVIGHTATPLFDAKSEHFLLNTGDRVEFVSETP
ncbi:MAG: 5-oxoprolinase subunit PxpB [Chthoniobacterales bacterium]